MGIPVEKCRAQGFAIRFIKNMWSRRGGEGQSNNSQLFNECVRIEKV